LIAKNGKPLNANEAADEQKRIEKQVRDIEKREAEKERKAAQEREVNRDKRVSIADVLRASKLINPRRERFRGREVIVFDFEPLPGYNHKKITKSSSARWRVQSGLTAMTNRLRVLKLD
jgi:hypothetical protein